MLDPANIAKNALQYHAEGLLCAQRIPETNFYISTAEPNVRCAIGAGLTREQAVKAEDHSVRHGVYEIDKLIQKGLFKVAHPTHARQLRTLQDLHDQWSTGNVSEEDFLTYARELAG